MYFAHNTANYIINRPILNRNTFSKCYLVSVDRYVVPMSWRYFTIWIIPECDENGQNVSAITRLLDASS